MNDKPNGGPAFPWDGMGDDGMTLRDYFAAKAMGAAVSVWALDSDMTGFDKYCQNLAHTCYGIADAMLKERSK